MEKVTTLEKRCNFTPDEPEVLVVEQFSPADENKALATIKPADLTVLHEIDEKIKSFKERFTDLKIEDEQDKDGYEIVRLALGDMRPTRTALNAQRKEVTAPYLTTAKYISSQFNAKINEIAAIEAPLKERKKEIDDIEKIRKEEEIKQKEVQLNNRVSGLSNAGCSFDGEYYSFDAKPELGISGASIGVVDIRVMSDAMFNQFLQAILDKAAMVKNEQARLQKIKEEEEISERLRREAQDKQDQEARDRIAKEYAEFAKKQKDFEDKQNAWQEEQDKVAAKNRHLQHVRESEEIAQLQAFNKRDEQLQSLGFNRNGNFYGAFGETYFTVEDVAGVDFDTMVKELVPVLEAKTKSVEAKREADRKAEEKIISDKAIADKAEFDRLQKIKDEEELAKASDKKKYDVLIAALRAVSIPEMKNLTYKKRVQEINVFLESL